MLELKYLDYEELWRDLYVDPRENYAVEDVPGRRLKIYGAPDSGPLALLTSRLGSWTVQGPASRVAKLLDEKRR